MERMESASTILSQEQDQAESETTGSNNGWKNTQVAIRVRPMSVFELKEGVERGMEVIDKSVIVMKKPGDTSAFLKTQALDFVTDFFYDRVFQESTPQATVYEETVQPLLSRFFEGIDVTILAYGMTGAGKTFTMMGPGLSVSPSEHDTPSEDNAGIIPRALQEVFAFVKQRRRMSVTPGEAQSLHLSCLEVVGEQLYDLLDNDPLSRPLPLRETPHGIHGDVSVTVAGLKEVLVPSQESASQLLAEAMLKRRTAPTMVNTTSSRSHCVITLRLQQVQRLNDGRERIIESRLSLVDLAGSERASKTQSSGQRLIEGGNINKSLLALGNCIAALAEGKAPRYRDSKLTLLLKPSLRGAAQLLFLATVSPAPSCFDETLRTLQYASRAKKIKLRPGIRQRLLESTSLEREAKLREENAALRKHVKLLQEEMLRLEGVVDILTKQLEDEREGNSHHAHGHSQPNMLNRLSMALRGGGSHTPSDHTNTNNSRNSVSSSHNNRRSSSLLAAGENLPPPLPPLEWENDVGEGEEADEPSPAAEGDDEGEVSLVEEAKTAAAEAEQHEVVALSLPKAIEAKPAVKKRGGGGFMRFFACGGGGGSAAAKK